MEETEIKGEDQYFVDKECYLQRLPIELFHIMTRIVKEETLKVETVGYRYKKQFEWSGSAGNKKMVKGYIFGGYVAVSCARV